MGADYRKAKRLKETEEMPIRINSKDIKVNQVIELIDFLNILDCDYDLIIDLPAQHKVTPQ